MKVYIIGDYDEDGTDGVMATTDPAKVIAMITRWAAKRNFGDVSKEVCLAMIAVETGEPGKFHLSIGWGGMLLYIVDLDADQPIA